MPNVIHFCSDLSRSGGGLSTAVVPIASRLRSAGGDWLGHLAGFKLPESDAEGLSWLRLRAMGPRNFPLATEFSSQVATLNPSLLHLHGLWTALGPSVRSYSSRYGVPYVVSPHGMLDPWALRNSRMKKIAALSLFERATLFRADCIHALNAAEHEAIRRVGFGGPIAVIPNGIDIAVSSGGLRKPAVLGQDGRRILLFMGRIHPKKGCRELIRAWGMVREASPNLTNEWRLVIAGWDDGNHLAHLMSEVVKLGLSDDVVFTGGIFGDDKVATFHDASAFILPSFSEGMPMTVLEAWQTGLPVFMTEACNLPEGFSEKAATRVSTDPAEMAAALSRGLTNEYGLGASALAGKRLVKKRFSWEVVAQDWTALYDWLYGRGPVPGNVDGPPHRLQRNTDRY